MRRTVIAGVVALCAALSACGGADEPAASSSSSSSSTSSSAHAPPSSAAAPSSSGFPSQQLPASQVESQFVTFVREQGYAPSSETDTSVVDLGRAICQRYDAGGSYVDVESILTGGGLSESEAGGFNAAAIVAFCPAHADQIAG